MGGWVGAGGLGGQRQAKCDARQSGYGRRMSVGLPLCWPAHNCLGSLNSGQPPGFTCCPADLFPDPHPFQLPCRHSVMAGSALPPIVDRAEGLGESEDVSSNIVLGGHAAAARAAMSAAPAATTLTGALSAAPAAAQQAVAVAAAAQQQQQQQQAQQEVQQAPQLQQAQQAIVSMAGWRQLQTTPIGGSLPAAGSCPPGSGEGTGHATATGLHSTAVGVVPSLPLSGGDSAPGQLPQGARPPLPHGSPQQLLQQQAQAKQALVRRAATNEGQQGSNSPANGPMEEGEQQAQWPLEAAVDAAHGHKRQRQASPPPG